jgi:FAD/FMN-containing dehydrogenase
VKGGGCTTNPGFSSTDGVVIAMSRFNETKVDSTSGTVEIGAGLTWDKVYAALESTGVNVVGGRNPGLGVSGLTLGGGRCLFSSEGFGIWISDTCATGYSYKSSQYGLTIDTVTGYELVLPNGTVINVTPNDRDLWFGLRVSRAISILVGITKSSITGRTQ